VKMPEYQIEQRGEWWIITCEGHEMPPFTQYATAAEAEAEAERWRVEDEQADENVEQELREAFYEEQNKL
jgi:hypothetical protein